jgi:2-polyprenyl-6-methoxyphenol hydroxylase-like FAD-dependent oxidoreductase
MGDFEDNSGWKDEGRLYMTSRGSLESFPLPEGRRRYVLRTPLFIKEYTSDYLEREIPRRCGIDVSKAARFWESGFGVQHYLAEKFCSGRVFLCGDAAHVMSPTGGQNMNTGFADAELAVYLIQRSITGPKNIKQISLVYESLRKKAARSASWRAGFLMKFGTSGGIIWNALRFLLSFIILHSPIKRILIPVLGMMTIPNRNLNSCRNRVERLIGV